MNKNKNPASKEDFIFLRAYLKQVVAIENKCKDNFSYTEWYLNGKYSKEEVNEIIKYFRKSGAKCDCDLIFNFN